MEAALIGPTGRTTLGQTAVTLGRMPGSQLLITDPQASSHHAEIRPDGQRYLIVDLGSTNGTYVNEERLVPQAPRPLVSGDRIRIGNTAFQYELSASSLIAPTEYIDRPGQHNAPAVDYQAAATAAPANYPVYGAAAPGPGGYASPSYQQPYPGPGRKRSRRGLWIVLGIIVLLLIVAIALVAIASANRSTPARTLSAFCAGLKARDYQSAYQQLSAGLQSRESEARFAATLDRVGGVKDCTFSSIQQNGSTATALVTLSVNLSFVPPINYDVTLTNQQGNWKIDGLQVRS